MENDKILQTLDLVYEKALAGIPGAGSVEELASDYLSQKKNINEQVDNLIRWQVGKCAASGFVTGLGGAVTLPITIPIDIASVLYIQIRMIAAIAYMGGYNLRDDRVRTFIFLCLCGNEAKDLVKNLGIQIGKKLTEKAIQSMSEKLIVQINPKIGFELMTKLGGKGLVNLSKAVPIVGGAIGGSVDGFSANVVGKIAKRIFIEK